MSSYSRALVAHPSILIFIPLTIACWMIIDFINTKLQGVNMTSGKSASGYTYPTSFTGVAGLDELLSILANAFTPSISGEKRHMGATLQWEYFSGFLVAVYAIYLVEAGRKTNRGVSGALVKLLPVFFLLAQLMTGAKWNPMYLFIVLLHNATLSSSDKSVRRNYVVAALPAFLLFVASSAMSFQHISGASYHYWNVLWQPFPLWLSAIIFVLEPLISSISSDNDLSSSADRPWLSGLYSVAFVVSFASHAAVLLTALNGHRPFDNQMHGRTSREMLLEIFVPKWSTQSHEYEGVLRLLFQWDLITVYIQVLLFAVSIYSIRRQQAGTATLGIVEGIQITVALIVASGLIGPGGAFVGFWALWIEPLSRISNNVKKIQ